MGEGFSPGKPSSCGGGAGVSWGFFYEGAEPIPRFGHQYAIPVSGKRGTSRGFCRPRGTRGHHVALTAHTLLLWGGRPEESLGHTTATFDASSLSSPPGSAPEETRWEVERLV